MNKSWWDVLNYLQNFYSLHPNAGQLSAKDLQDAVALYLRIDTEAVELPTQAPFMCSPVVSVYVPNSGSVIVRPLVHRGADLIIRQNDYMSFRNVVVNNDPYGSSMVYL